MGFYKASEFFLTSEEKKTIIELKIGGSGINKGYLILKAETLRLFSNVI